MFIFIRIALQLPVYNNQNVTINDSQLLTIITQYGLVNYANLKKKRLISEIFKYHFDDQFIDILDFTIIIQEIAIREINDPILDVDLQDSKAIFRFKDLNIQVTFNFRLEQKKFPFSHGDGTGIVKILESIAQTNVVPSLQNSQLDVRFNDFDYNPTNFKIELTGSAIYGAVIDALHDLFKQIISEMFDTICPQIFSEIVKEDMNSIPMVQHFTNQYVQDQRIIDYFSTQQFQFFVIYMPGFKCYHDIDNNSCLNPYLDDKYKQDPLIPTLMNAEIQYIIGQQAINSQYSIVKNISIENTSYMIDSIDVQLVNMGVLTNMIIKDNGKAYQLSLLSKFNTTLLLGENLMDQLCELTIDFDDGNIINNTGAFTTELINNITQTLYTYLSDQHLNFIYGQVNDVNMTTCQYIYQHSYAQIYCNFKRPNDE